MKKRLAKMIRTLALLLEEEKKIPIPAPINSSEILKNKIALITGGSSGIGLSMAKSFIKSGAKVIIAGTNEEKLCAC